MQGMCEAGYWLRGGLRFAPHGAAHHINDPQAPSLLNPEVKAKK